MTKTDLFEIAREAQSPLLYDDVLPLWAERFAALIESAVIKRLAVGAGEPQIPAQHGFDRNASHNADEYVCECGAKDDEPCVAGYYTAEQVAAAVAAAIQKEQP